MHVCSCKFCGAVHVCSCKFCPKVHANSCKFCTIVHVCSCKFCTTVHVCSCKFCPTVHACGCKFCPTVHAYSCKFCPTVHPCSCKFCTSLISRDVKYLLWFQIHDVTHCRSKYQSWPQVPLAISNTTDGFKYHWRLQNTITSPDFKTPLVTTELYIGLGAHRHDISKSNMSVTVSKLNRRLQFGSYCESPTVIFSHQRTAATSSWRYRLLTQLFRDCLQTWLDRRQWNGTIVSEEMSYLIVSGDHVSARYALTVSETAVRQWGKTYSCYDNRHA